MTSLSQACLWDWDTLQMERQRFPGVLETMTGKFVRHSRDYYEWRIRDRKPRFRSPSEDPAVADDLAVAYSKLGDHAKAMELLEQVLEFHPDRYETLANLGTVHMLAGDLQTGKEFIDRAITINPDAHFGREKYQSLLAEYFLTARTLPHPAASGSFVIHPKRQYCGFAKFVLEKNALNPETDLDDKAVGDELAAAQQGLLGMMHFANHDSPMLLEALGDLLIAWPTYQEDALQLAALAYLRVSQLTDESEKKQFEMAAVNVLEGHLDYIRHHEANRDTPWYESTLSKLGHLLDRELAKGRTYFDTITVDERSWIAAGADVDREFAAKYYDSLEGTVEAAKEQLATERRDVRTGPYSINPLTGLAIFGLITVGLIAITIWLISVIRRRWRNHDEPH